MKNLFLLILVLGFTPLTWSTEPGSLAPSSSSASKSSAIAFAQHPFPQDPIYLNKSFYDFLKKQVPTPPTLASESQKKDKFTLIQFEKTRSVKDCERAESEVKVSLASLYGTPFGPLSDEQVQRWSDFFSQLRNESDYFIHRMKEEYARPRPYLYLQDLHPCVPREKSAAYPSGHAAIAELFALTLTELIPAKKELLFKRAAQIQEDRVLAGVHHPTDIQTGRTLGKLIFLELMKSSQFKEQLKALSMVH